MQSFQLSSRIDACRILSMPATPETKDDWNLYIQQVSAGERSDTCREEKRAGDSTWTSQRRVRGCQSVSGQRQLMPEWYATFCSVLSHDGKSPNRLVVSQRLPVCVHRVSALPAQGISLIPLIFILGRRWQFRFDCTFGCFDLFIDVDFLVSCFGFVPSRGRLGMSDVILLSGISG